MSGSAPTDEPIALADVGSFYAGGRAVRIEGEPVREIAFTRAASLSYDPNGLYRFEQAYVQYFVPARLAQPLPLVLLHGGGMTGAMWEHTPDGRPGWLRHFLRQGHAVYVVDNVERGRAGWAPFTQVWPDAPIMRTAEESWSLFRFGRAEDFASRRAFDGQRFPVAAFDAFLPQAVPRWLGNNDAALRGFCAALDRNGFLPTHNLVYSKPQGDDPVWNAANCRNKRIFDDRAGITAARSTRPFVVQAYARDMGGGKIVMMQEVDAPLRIFGRHWGGLRTAYRA